MNEDQLQSLINTCPHLSGMTPEEQREAIKQNRSILQQHLNNVSGKIPDICPYAAMLNGPAIKSEDYKCGICKHYLFKAKLVMPCYHHFCEACLRRNNVSLSSNCPVCQKDILKIEDDGYIQYMTNSYIDMQFDLSLEELNEVPDDVNQREIFTAEQEMLFNLNLAIGRPHYIFNIERSLAYLHKALNIGQNQRNSQNEAIGNLIGVVYGKLGEIYDRVGQLEEAKQNFEKSILQFEELAGKNNLEILHGIRISMIKLADLYLYRMKNYSMAQSLYEKTQKYEITPVDKLPVLIKLGEAKLAQGNKEAAKSELHKARQLIHSIPRTDYVQKCEQVLNDIELRMANFVI
jgi:tetratricopeptide (TPR) repeat protein